MSFQETLKIQVSFKIPIDNWNFDEIKKTQSSKAHNKITYVVLA